MINDESIHRIDNAIQQVDISQMEPAVSHQSDTTEDTHQVAHTLTNDDDDDIDESSSDDKSQTICSSHHDEEEEEDSVDEFLQRNAHIIEGYFDENPEQDVAPDGEKVTDRNLSFSWMIVDKDGPLTRLESNSVQL